MKVLVAGCFDDGPGYPRPRVLLDALRSRHDVRVLRCTPAWAGQSKRALLRAPWRLPRMLWRQRSVQRRFASELLAELRQGPKPDAVLVPYPGHGVVRIVRTLWSGPLVLDLFLSMRLTVEDGGGLVGRTLGYCAGRVDRRAVRCADLALLDTPQHADAVAERLGMRRELFDHVPVGDPDAPAAVAPMVDRTGPLRVLFFGTGVPLHGLSTLLTAAERDGGRTFQLELIGGAPRDRARAASLPSCSVGPSFVGRAELGRRIDEVDVVAGIFGTSQKADCVVPYKVLHALAHGRPVVTRDGAGIRAALEPGVDCCVVPPGDAAAVVAALGGLRDFGVRRSMGAAARARFDRSFAAEPIAERLESVLRRLVPSSIGGVAPPRPVAVPSEAP